MQIQIVVVYWMGGLRRNAWAFLGQYGVSLLAMLVAQVSARGGYCSG